MRGQADPTTPAMSDTLKFFQGVLAPLSMSRRETGQEVSPRSPTSNAAPSLVQRKGRSPGLEPGNAFGSPPSSDSRASPLLPVTTRCSRQTKENAPAN